METIVQWYQNSIGQYVPKEIFVLMLSMLPFIELRGGLIAASLLDIPLLWANVICVAGNIIPIPFILLFIRGIFNFMKKHNILRGMVERLERHAEKKSDGLKRGEFIFLMLFVGIPIPGTGAWTGALIAALMELDLKKASIAIATGLFIAVVIMDIISYGLIGQIA